MKLKQIWKRGIALMLLAQLLLTSALAMPGEAESGFGSAASEHTDAAQKTYADFKPRECKSGETLKKGIDISYYQGHPDWEAVRKSGVDFAFIRVGYRTYGTNVLYEDVYWKQNVEEAIAAGLQVGVYIFSQAATTEEAAEEAQFLVDRVEDYNITLPLVMDFEYACDSSGQLTGHLYNAHLTKEETTEVCKAFCDVVEAERYAPAIYASMNILENKLDATAFQTIWLAHYTTQTDYTGDYAFWQCTGNGRVNGIQTATDLDFWYDDGTDYSRLPLSDDSLPFRDVSKTSWSYSDIQYCYQNGIIAGRTKTHFDPQANITRGEVVTMLYRAAGSPEISGSSTFTDLTMDYYRTPIYWAQYFGIAAGRSETIFDPDSYITRQDFVALLYRFESSPAVSDTSVLNNYVDAGQINAYARNAMAWAVSNHIMTGMSSDTLAPDGSATREQIAALIARLMKSSAHQ